MLPVDMVLADIGDMLVAHIDMLVAHIGDMLVAHIGKGCFLLV